jgi:hypothetical protein
MQTQISNKAVLVSLRISCWIPSKTDKQVTSEVILAKAAASDAGAFKKNVLPEAAYRPLQAMSQNIRRFHYNLTSPWLDEGARILPAELQQEYADKMRQLRGEYAALVTQQFNDTAYDGYIAEAKLRLGAMFNPNDYPTAEQVRAKYGVSVVFTPLPESEDFRLKLNNDIVDEMKAQYEAELKNHETVIKRDIYARLGAKVGHLSKKLKDFDASGGEGKRLHGTLIEGVRDICRLIPALNIHDDPEIEQIKNETLARVARWEIDTIKDDEAVRKEVVTDADAILRSMGLA